MRKTILAIAMGLMLVSTGWADTLVWFSPSATDVTVGDTFTVSIYADIPEPDALIGWDMDYLFNDSVLANMGVAMGAGWDAVPSLSDGGLAALTPLDAVWGDDVLLGTVTMQATGTGTSAITGGFLPPDDPLSGLDGFMSLNGFVSVTLLPTSVGVMASTTPVPEPATLLLMGLGVLGIGVMRRRR